MNDLQKLTADTMTGKQGTVKINGGKLYIYGNYTIDNPYDTTYCYFKMTNENDYVYVGGNFFTDTYYNHADYFKNGVMEIKGNLKQGNNTNGGYSFRATGNHKVILSCTEKQEITFENPP